MESYLSLHSLQSEHRTKISEAFGQDLRSSYSKTSSTHKVLTLSYSRSRQNCAQSQSSSHSLHGQRSKVQISDDAGSGSYRARYRSATASGSKSMCRLPIPEPSYSLIRARSRPKVTTSRQSIDVSPCEEKDFPRDEKRMAQRGRRQSRTAFAKIHEKYRIRQDYSPPSTRNNRNGRPPPYGSRNSRPQTPANFDSESDNEDFGVCEMKTAGPQFPEIPDNLNDSKEFRELMDFPASVLGKNKTNHTQDKEENSALVLQESYKDSNFSRTTSLSSINSTMWKHAIEIETDDEEEWLTKALGQDTGNYAKAVVVDDSQVIETATETATVESTPEVQWWYDYVEPKSARNDTKGKDKLQLSPSQNFGSENFIGASIAQRYRSRYRGMFNPSPRILDKTVHDLAIPTGEVASLAGSIENNSQDDKGRNQEKLDHPKNLPVPSKAVKLQKTLSPYFSSAMAEFGSIDKDNSGNSNIPAFSLNKESTSEYVLDNVYSGQLSNYSSIREAHKRRERRDEFGQRPDSVLKSSSNMYTKIETQMKNKSRTPAGQQIEMKRYQYDSDEDSDTRLFTCSTKRNTRYEFPCAHLPPLPDVILSDISLSGGLNSISEPEYFSDGDLTDTDISAHDSVSNTILDKYIEDVAKSYPEESGIGFNLSDSDDEEDNFDKKYFDDDAFLNDSTPALNPVKVKNIQTRNPQRDGRNCLSKDFLDDFDGLSAQGETFSSYRSPGHMASYELYASEIDADFGVPGEKEIGTQRITRAQFTEVCCPKSSTWSSKERNSFKPIHKTEDEKLPSEGINENSTEDSAHKGHLLPGGLERAQVDVKGIITQTYEPLMTDEVLPDQSDENQEDAPTDEGESKNEQKSENSDTNKGSKKSAQTSETSDNTSPQSASTSQQATTSTRSAGATSKKPKATTKKHQQEDQNQNSKKTTTIRPKTSVPTNNKTVSNVKAAIRGTQSAPAKVQNTGLKSPRNASTSGSKPTPVRLVVKTPETVHQDGKSPTRKGTKRSKKKKSETTAAPNAESSEPVAGPSNASAVPIEPTQPTTVTTTNPIPIFAGLQPPRPTLKQSSKIGQSQSQERKSTRHVSIKLPEYAVESGTFEPSGQNDENILKQDDDDDRPSPSVKILIPTTHDASGFRPLGSYLNENPIPSSSYRSSNSGSGRPGTPGIPTSSPYRGQNPTLSSGHYRFNDNSPGGSGYQKSGADADQSQHPSPTSLRAQANQSGYFSLLLRQRKLTEQNDGTVDQPQQQQERLPILRNPQETLLPPPPMIVTPVPVEPNWNENPTTTSVPIRIAGKAETNVKGKSNARPPQVPPRGRNK